MNNDCFGCELRTADCHTTREEYKQFQKKCEQVRKSRQKMNFYNDYTFHVKRVRRRKADD